MSSSESVPTSHHSPPDIESEPDWITIAAAAQLSGRSPTQFYVWRSKGRAPVRMEEMDGRVHVNAADLKQWMAANPLREKAPAKEKSARVPQHSLKPAPPSSRPEEVRSVANRSAAPQFSFTCATGSELKQWAEFLDELTRRGVALKFRIDGGRITLS